MFDWKSQFTLQRKDYVLRTLDRLSAMEQLLQAVAQNPKEPAPLRELSQHFHQLAGSSAIYELDNLGHNAGEAEKVSLNALRSGGGIDKAEWTKLKDAIDAMRFICSQHPDVLQQQQPAQPAGASQPSAGTSAPANAGAANTAGGQSTPATVAGPTVQRDSGTWTTIPGMPFNGTPGRLEKPKDIIVVDGDQTNMMTLTRALESAGMQVRGYRTTDGAKKALETRLPDALILSIPLIDGPGYDVAYHLRGLPEGHHPPIIIISRQIGFLDKVTAIRCGADAFFNELGDAEAVVKKLHSLFERDKPEQYTILSVEDDNDQSRYIKKILESVGYNVHTISDPRLFEEAFLSVKPDLLLLDVMLGPVSGFELARYVRADDQFAATPIIFLTTQNQLNAHVESARVGGDEHLIKPVAPQLLVAAVAGRLERYRVLKKLIGRDGLTGLLTLSGFMEEAEKMVNKGFHGSGSVVLLLVDVDHMELINDRYGYAAGDRVIASTAQMLKRKLRNAEVIARIGGDDFAIIMDNVNDRELAEVATQIVQEFEKHVHVVSGFQFTATISAGAALLDSNMDLKTWLTNAQLALKSAKSNGRNCVMKAKARTTRSY